MLSQKHFPFKMKKKLKNFHVISQGGSQKAIKVGCQLPTGEGGHLPPAGGWGAWPQAVLPTLSLGRVLKWNHYQMVKGIAFYEFTTEQSLLK